MRSECSYEIKSSTQVYFWGGYVNFLSINYLSEHYFNISNDKVILMPTAVNMSNANKLLGQLQELST